MKNRETWNHVCASNVPQMACAMCMRFEACASNLKSEKEISPAIEHNRWYKPNH